jgi:hypothetical protein
MGLGVDGSFVTKNIKQQGVLLRGDESVCNKFDALYVSPSAFLGAFSLSKLV